MEHELWYRQPAALWNEALPVGNGALGAMVFGGVQTDDMPLNHDTLWSGYPQREPLKNVSDAVRRAGDLARAGRADEAQKLLEAQVCGPFHEGYLPMGTLTARDDCGAATEYRRSLDLNDACARVSYTADGCRVSRAAYASHPANALVLTWRFSRPSTLRLSLSSYLRGERREGLPLVLRGQCPSHVDPIYVNSADPIRYDDARPGIRFAMGLIADTDGEQTRDDTELVISGATRVLAVLMAETSFRDYATDPTDAEWACEARLRARLGACTLDEESLWAAHVADYQAMESACVFHLDGARDSLPTDERLRGFRGDDAGLYELLFRYGRYLLIASSRAGSQPANLQGIWNADMRAPWCANYTVNINTEMNYWPAFAANLASCALPLIQMVRELSDTGANVARAVHGAAGWCAHHNVDIWRHCTPVGNYQQGCAVYGYWSMGGAWLCRAVWEYYEYTQDENYLRDTGLPLLAGAAEFLLSQLEDDGQGALILCPSTSPENEYLLDGRRLAVAPFTAMTQWICEDVLRNTQAAQAALKMPPDARVDDALSRLRRPGVAGDGRMTEWDQPLEEAEMHHRHVSPLYGLHPARLIEPHSALGEACRRTLLARGDEGTGWSLAWKICLWARLREGDHALHLLDQQLRAVPAEEKQSFSGGGSYPNLLCAHPPFQIDGNFGAAAGILEMLLQWEDGETLLLPALPARWTGGRLAGARAPGGLTVDITWQNGALLRARVTAAREGAYRVRYGERRWTLTLAAGEAALLTR